jgi:hypothetical protein
MFRAHFSDQLFLHQYAYYLTLATNALIGSIVGIAMMIISLATINFAATQFQRAKQMKLWWKVNRWLSLICFVMLFIGLWSFGTTMKYLVFLKVPDAQVQVSVIIFTSDFGNRHG